MKISEIILGNRNFFKEDGIRLAVANSSYFDPSLEDVNKSDCLLIFKTSSQQSWLVFTNIKIYFVLDDKTESVPDVRWRRTKKHLIIDNRIVIDLKLENKSDKTGRINIGRMNKGFLYTKVLFRNHNIKKVIYELITKQMLNKNNFENF